MIRPIQPKHTNGPPPSLSMGKVPTELVLRDTRGQKIEKLCGQSDWQRRIISVTAEKMLISHPDRETEIADQIPLVSCTVVRRDGILRRLTIVFDFSMRSNHRTDLTDVWGSV